MTHDKYRPAYKSWSNNELDMRIYNDWFYRQNIELSGAYLLIKLYVRVLWCDLKTNKVSLWTCLRVPDISDLKIIMFLINLWGFSVLYSQLYIHLWCYFEVVLNIIFFWRICQTVRLTNYFRFRFNILFQLFGVIKWKSLNFVELSKN